MTQTDVAAGSVLPLSALGRDDVAGAGGKGANLGELVRAGFPVPGGFVVSTDAYAAIVADAGLGEAIATADGDGGAAARAAFEVAAIPDAVRSAIMCAYAELGGGPVAVRSSATAEDLPGAAFAGQQDTYLNVVGSDALLDAVRRCWGSLWTERAITYRARLDIDPSGVRIAVVIQQMVPAAFAGVAFTANPVTGDRDEVVVDASSGLGEAVVSGLVTPDHFVLDANGRVRERRRGRREVVVRAAAEGGVVHRTDEEATELPDAVLAELAAVARAVAAHFGRPQDVEWAYAEGRLWLLQARPMTALPPAPIHLSRIQRITGPQIIEMLPVRPYPMDMSAWLLPGPGRLVRRMLHEIAGFDLDFTAVLPERDGIVDRYVPPQPRFTLAVLTAPARLLPRIRRFRPAEWTRDPRFVRFDRQMRELTARDPRELGGDELRWLPRRALDAMDEVTTVRVDYLPRVGFDLLRLHGLLVVLRRTVLSGLLTLGARTRTEDANRALAQLAERVRADGALRAVFELEPEALAEWIGNDPAFAAFRAELTALLDEYGHRETASALLLSTSTWRDSPATVLGLVKVLVQDAPVPAAARARWAEQQLLTHPLVRLTRSGPRVRRLLQDARAGIAFREDTHFHFTRALPVVRRAVLEMGRRLAVAGVLRDAQDVLHLRLEEVEGIADSSALAPDEADRLRSIVRARSARRTELARVPLIAPATLFPHQAAGDALATGVPASGGRATGPARVLAGPADFGRLRSGDVLVCPYTNPSWTPLFQRAVAVVADTGGIGSHAAIVAREYGIPAVMGTGTGTTSLVDGQRVTVDGDTGRVLPADDDGSGTPVR